MRAPALADGLCAAHTSPWAGAVYLGPDRPSAVHVLRNMIGPLKHGGVLHYRPYDETIG